MSETVKRLKPKGEVLSRLFALSGNVCAYPNCSNLMLNTDGTFIGQVCHIKAANEGGERFDVNMTNEQRRSFENLMLMCYEHHRITNDVHQFTVEVLQNMKKEHESKFTVNVVINSMLENLKDYTLVDDFEKVSNLHHLFETHNKVHGYTQVRSIEEIEDDIETFNYCIEKYLKLSPITRKYFWYC